VELASVRKHGFVLERAVFLVVPHRLFVSGSEARRIAGPRTSASPASTGST
jgi:hypothetical protein